MSVVEAPSLGRVVLRCVTYPLTVTPVQGAVLDEQGDAARALWNLIHAFYTFHEDARRWPLWREVDAAIREGRKEIDWLDVLPAQAAQQVLRAYRQAWVNYWGGSHRRPTWRARRARRAVDVPQARDLNLVRLNRKWAAVQIPKVGRVKLRLHRALPDRVTGARLVRQAAGWVLVVRGENHVRAPQQRPSSCGSVGVDRGVTHTLALSDGTFHDQGPTLSVGERKHLYRLECRAARQRAHRARGQRQSGRERQTYTRIAAIAERRARRRGDFAHQVSAAIINGGIAAVAVEGLRIANMTRTARGSIEQPGSNVAAKAGLNRAILDQGWAQVHTFLKYKAEQAGARVLVVDPRGTSQTCHRCGSTAPGQRESQAVFRCANPDCGWTGNADTNAAIIIDQRGQEVALQDVEPNATRQAVKRQNRETAA